MGAVVGIGVLFYTIMFMDIYSYNEIHMSVFDKLYGKPINEETSLIEVAMYYDRVSSTLIPVMIISVLYIILKAMFTFTIGYLFGKTITLIFFYLYLGVLPAKR
ncbi:hypothetical protein [Virgibacillus sp. Bac332]|uniref:hypothetical protein n=1 Tax=Virgibacillus sp. Bac332 TaxID=2419842 RepID=UPI0013CEBE3B|nr:hypothetical protein [Virgibacillus sp. Bac332]